MSTGENAFPTCLALCFQSHTVHFMFLLARFLKVVQMTPPHILRTTYPDMAGGIFEHVRMCPDQIGATYSADVDSHEPNSAESSSSSSSRRSRINLSNIFGTVIQNPLFQIYPCPKHQQLLSSETTCISLRQHHRKAGRRRDRAAKVKYG